MLFTKPKKAIGIDIGNHSVKVVQMSRSGSELCVDEAGYALIDRNQYTNDAVGALANAVRAALEPFPVSSALLVGALPGQTVVVRYPRLPDTPRDMLAAAIQREAGQNIPYDLSEVFLDSTLLTETVEGDTKQLKMLLVAAKHEIIDARVQVANAAEIQFSVLTVDSLALADAAEACRLLRKGESVALVNIGHTSASIHFVKNGVSNFIRDVSWGARELIQAIVKDRRCTPDEAERALQDAGLEEESPSSTAPVPEAPREAAGSPLDPLDDELGGLDEVPGTMPVGVERESRDLREALSIPLGRMVAEIRRSFDYYEHQLYEQPVSRLIVSGGIAHIPIVGETLMDELEVETVEVANPLSGGVLIANEYSIAPLQERPAQFMVALGLAARGMAEL